MPMFIMMHNRWIRYRFKLVKAFNRFLARGRQVLFLAAVAIPLAASPLCAKEAGPSWPLPPDPARIVFLESFSSPNDFHIEKSLWTKFWEFVMGEEVRYESLSRPTGVFASKGKVYITDTASPGVHIFDLNKKEYYFFNRIPFGTLKSPVSIAANAGGDLYVSDSMLGRVFIFNREGKFKGEIGSHGELARPSGLAIHPVTQELYVADTLAHTIKIFDGGGALKSSVGRRGGRKGELNFPSHISIDREGRLYVSDTLNYRVQVFDASGEAVSALGEAGNMVGQFSRPKGVAADPEGHIYVVDGMYDVVQMFSQKGDLLMSFGNGGGSGSGQFWLANGIYIDGDTIYVADTGNSRIQVFKYLGDVQADPDKSL